MTFKRLVILYTFLEFLKWNKNIQTMKDIVYMNVVSLKTINLDIRLGKHKLEKTKALMH